MAARRAALLRPLRPALLVANGFPWRIPPAVLDLPPLGAVNLHPALLPRYRGAMTPFWMLRHGEVEAGQTLHRMSASFDTGAILGQVRFAIEDDDDIHAWQRNLLAHMPRLWAQALPRIALGEAGEPQDEATATYFGNVADEAAWKTIDRTQPARAVHNVVRSCGWADAQPAGALGTIDGASQRITRTRLVADITARAAPGTVVGRDGEVLLVQCGDGPLTVVEYEPA